MFRAPAVRRQSCSNETHIAQVPHGTVAAVPKLLSMDEGFESMDASIATLAVSAWTLPFAYRTAAPPAPIRMRQTRARTVFQLALTSTPPSGGVLRRYRQS